METSRDDTATRQFDLDRGAPQVPARGHELVATDDADILAEARRSGNATFGVPVLVANGDVDRAKLYGRGYYNKVLKTMGDEDANADVRAIVDDLFLLANADGFVATGAA